jgi:di/tricarboxylate transporter
MNLDQVLILGVLSATIVAFIWGRLRHDVVALASLLVCAVLGLVEAAEVFSGFGHPAVITVACVLVLSSGLQATGAVDVLAQRLLPRSSPAGTRLFILIVLAAGMSAFMNNVGALALLMPVGLQLAERENIAPGKVLMPLAFGSILGGMTTMIGTPPNLIVAGFREQEVGQTFSMFDFAPVGVGIVVMGLIFVGIAARYLVPNRSRAGIDGFETSAYITEARVPERSKAAGMSLGDVESLLKGADAMVVGLVRAERRIPAPSQYREIHVGDILQIRAEHDALAAVLSALDLHLEEATSVGARSTRTDNVKAVATEGGADRIGAPSNDGNKRLASGETSESLIELAVLPSSVLAGRSVSDIRVRTRYGINLLAISRQGHQVMDRLRAMRIKTGDVLLMQGAAQSIAEFAARYGCVPLASRSLRLPARGLAVPAMVIMAASIALAAFGWLAPATAFACGVLAMLLLGIVPVRSLYSSVDWPVIVLLGALIPVAAAMSSTGTADLIATFLLDGIAQGRPVFGLAVILIVSMTLSDFMNNAATAAVMCPIAIGTAAQLGASPDPFLMAVAVGASCAFLTPIGHQNNTLILGPGGFRFGDYWPLGLPLEILVVAVSVPLITIFWPLAGN